jgi:hypothetical protein
MQTLLSYQALQDDQNGPNRSIGSTLSLALCGSSISTFWC